MKKSNIVLGICFLFLAMLFGYAIGMSSALHTNQEAGIWDSATKLIRDLFVGPQYPKPEPDHVYVPNPPERHGIQQCYADAVKAYDACKAEGKDRCIEDVYLPAVRDCKNNTPDEDHCLYDVTKGLEPPASVVAQIDCLRNLPPYKAPGTESASGSGSNSGNPAR